MNVEGRSPTQLAFRRFRKNPRAVISLVLVTLIGVATIFVPILSSHPFDEPHYLQLKTGITTKRLEFMRNSMLVGKMQNGILANLISYFHPGELLI